MYRLVFSGGWAARPPRVVREPVLWIGRDETCQLRLTENGVDARHAAIERREDGYYLCDLDSANGVRVNHQPVHQHRLASGEELEIGAVQMRFEILHGAGSPRRVSDTLQLVAAGIIAVLLAGQLGGLAWMLSQPRPVREPIPSVRAVASAETPPPALPPPARPAPAPAPTPARPPAARPPVLTRMIRLERVGESRESGRLVLTVQAKAQVGERTLEARAVGLCVQFYLRQPDESLTLWRYPFWLKIGDWDNFSRKTFTAVFPGAADEYGGYVVRSYYRGQLQDALAKPNSLLAFAPDPMVN